MPLVLPWECVVLGVPASVQGSSRRRSQWKGEVAKAALARWPSGRSPLTCHLHFGVTFFHDEAPLDADNMLKPIQDALIGIAYVDDNQIRGFGPPMYTCFLDAGPYARGNLDALHRIGAELVLCSPCRCRAIRLTT